MLKKNQLTKLRQLVDKTIEYFEYFKQNNWVVKPSIPILFFGNLEQYFNSEIKIITVGLNPSDKEFPIRGKGRFSICPEVLKKDDKDKYLSSLSEYFENNPYNDWFGRQLTKILKEFNASFYSDHNITNRAIHTDICTPIATVPTWDKLKKKYPKKKLPDQFKKIEKLKDQGFNLWLKLVKILQPHIILISVREEYLNKFKFVKILKSNDSDRTSFLNKDTVKNPKFLEKKNIKLYKYEELPYTKIYFGGKCSGYAFSNFAYENNNLKEIQKIGQLIKKDCNHINW